MSTIINFINNLENIEQYKSHQMKPVVHKILKNECRINGGFIEMKTDIYPDETMVAVARINHELNRNRNGITFFSTVNEELFHVAFGETPMLIFNGNESILCDDEWFNLMLTYDISATYEEVLYLNEIIKNNKHLIMLYCGFNDINGIEL